MMHKNTAYLFKYEEAFKIRTILI